MGALDLVDRLDGIAPHWRDDLPTHDDYMVEELMFWFLSRNQGWLDDLVPPCISRANAFEWFMNLFNEDGPCAKQARFTAYGYCEKAIVDDLLLAAELEYAFD